MAKLLNNTYNAYHHIFYDLADRRSDKWFLMGSPWIPLSISLTYIYFVKVVGPRFMKNRPAYKLDKIIAVYNIAQVVLSLDLVLRAYSLGWGTKYKLFCEPVDYSNHPDAIFVATGIWEYYIIKIVDLLDTVFFILRKKDNQVTFLHVYHHSGMVVVSWLVARYVPGGHGTLVGATNCFVHVVMYFYYFVTNAWPEYKKNIWWKKYITQLQLAQFVFLMLHQLPILFYKDCPYPKFMACVFLLENVSMFILFSNFYRKAYGQKKKKIT